VTPKFEGVQTRKGKLDTLRRQRAVPVAGGGETCVFWNMASKLCHVTAMVGENSNREE